MKTLMITACLLLVALVSAQRGGSTTPKYFAPPQAGGPNININDPNINMNNPNVAQPVNGVGGGQFSSYDTPHNGNGASYVGAGGTPFPVAAGAGGNTGGVSNSAENIDDNTQENLDDGVDGSDVNDNGSVLNLDTDSDSDASVKKGVNGTAVGVVLTIIIVLGIFGVVAIVLIRQRRQNAARE